MFDIGGLYKYNLSINKNFEIEKRKIKIMALIKDKVFSSERALYNLTDSTLENCGFYGEEDGESALKESRNIKLIDCDMRLRYPLWHVKNLVMENCVQNKDCRAAIWYGENLDIDNCNFSGIKVVRECKCVNIKNSAIDSEEFGWRSDSVKIKNTSLNSVYAFFETNNIIADKLKFSGKYSFQYCKNIRMKDSVLNTKDAFWHTDGAVIENCEVNGEYLAWYSKNLTFINCRIRGTQPFCYAENLRLINCTMEDCDLSFEYSNVDADIKGVIPSVKNVTSGKIVADGYGEIIKEDSIFPLNAEIVVRSK